MKEQKIKKVIIVEDDLTEEFYRAQLSGSDFEIIKKYDTSQDFFQEYKKYEKEVDIVLIDLIFANHSILDGFGILERLNNEDYKASKVVITARTDLGMPQLNRIKQLGANGIIMKTVFSANNISLADYFKKITPDKFFIELNTAQLIVNNDYHKTDEDFVWTNLYDIAAFFYFVFLKRIKQNNKQIPNNILISWNKTFYNILKITKRKNYFLDNTEFGDYVKVYPITEKIEKYLQLLFHTASGKHTNEVVIEVYKDEFLEKLKKINNKINSIEEFREKNKDYVDKAFHNFFDTKKREIREFFELEDVIEKLKTDSGQVTKEIILRAFIKKFIKL